MSEIVICYATILIILCSVAPSYGTDVSSISLQSPSKDLPKIPALSLLGTTDTEITLKWSNVVNRDHSLTGYTLHYKKRDGPCFHVSLSPEKSSYTLILLEPDSVYDLHITANNEYGNGETSEILTVKTEQMSLLKIVFCFRNVMIVFIAITLIALYVTLVTACATLSGVDIFEEEDIEE